VLQQSAEFTLGNSQRNQQMGRRMTNHEAGWTLQHSTTQRGDAAHYIRRGCLTLMKHHIAINFDARFIALQKDCCSDNLLATV
jgi:hypothetical protein